MRKILKASAIVIAACTSSLAMGRQITSNSTRQDLLNAMKDRAFDYLKYTLYAEQAKRNGNARAAAILKRIAAAERDEHFMEHAKFFGLAASEGQNLENAVSIEYSPAGRTRQELLSAMKDAAFDYLKYTLYADQASKNGNAEGAAAFERIAAGRDAQFKEYAKYFGLVRSDAANMEAAISGEYLAAKSYPIMASRAQAAGDEEAARHFAKAAKDEAEHQETFKAVFFKRNS